MKFKRDLASMAYPRPSLMVETLNGHAKLNQFLRANPAPVFADRFALYDHVSAQLGTQPIDYLEFGVFKGESFARWMELNRDPESRFVGFDTFTGLPEDWKGVMGKGGFDTGGQAPDCHDPRGTFVKGLFQHTLPPFLEKFAGGRQLVVHNDSDLGSSTLYTLAKLNDLLVPGSIIIFDEFASPLHEFRVWIDYLAAFMRSATLIGTSGPYGEQAAFRFD